MDFPLFQVPYLGNGMTIGLNAVLHVILSHGIAIGGMLFITLAEWNGLRKSDEAWENFAKLMIKPTVIIITAVGAVTGVGIWFITTALAPRAIGSMLRIFFWPWFIEWLVFTAEVIVILIYYFTWDAWRSGKRKRLHVALGFFYPVLSVSSAILITGILGFMLTSDGWPWTGSFWSAFFNPSFIPQLILRLSAAMVFGTLYVFCFLLFGPTTPEFRREAISFYGRIGLGSLIIAVTSAIWYFKVVPSAFVPFSVFAVLTGHFSQYYDYFWVLNGLALLLLLLFLLLSAVRGVAWRALLIPSIIVAALFVAQYERIREFIRGPYLLPGYMYVNQVLLTERPLRQAHGALANEFWHTATAPQADTLNDGAFLFGQNCAQCHTIGGLNDIRARLKGRPKDAIDVLVKHAHEMVPFMPPFAGSQKDRIMMVEFLDALVNHYDVNNPPAFYTGIAIRERHK